MKFLLLVVLAMLASVQADLELMKEWETYKFEHKKTYATMAEELMRHAIWKSHREYVMRHNAEADKGVHTYWLAVNKFADMTNDEFVRIYNGYNYTMKTSTTSKAKEVFHYDPAIKVADKIVCLYEL